MKIFLLHLMNSNHVPCTRLDDSFFPRVRGTILEALDDPEKNAETNDLHCQTNDLHPNTSFKITDLSLLFLVEITLISELICGLVCDWNPD